MKNKSYYACLDCGVDFGCHFHLWVPDEIWNQIGCISTDVLCANCIIERMVKYGYSSAFLATESKQIIKKASIEISLKDTR